VEIRVDHVKLPVADLERTRAFYAAALAPLGARVQCDADLDALVASVVRDARRGDQVLVMSNGGFGGIHEKLLRALHAQ